MTPVLKMVLCAVMVLSSVFSHGAMGEGQNGADRVGADVTLLESFKFAEGDTLWGYWDANARTREMYRGDWGEFLAVVSQFNTVSEWRAVRPGTVVHIPLPFTDMIGFLIPHANADTATVVLEKSAAGSGLYRIKERTEPSVRAQHPEVLGDQRSGDQTVTDMKKEVEGLRVIVQELRQDMDTQYGAVVARSDKQVRLLKQIFAALLVFAAVFAIVLFFLAKQRPVDDRRGVEVLAQRLVAQERLRVAAEQKLRDEEIAHNATKRALAEVQKRHPRIVGA